MRAGRQPLAEWILVSAATTTSLSSVRARAVALDAGRGSDAAGLDRKCAHRWRKPRAGIGSSAVTSGSMARRVWIGGRRLDLRCPSQRAPRRDAGSPQLVIAPATADGAVVPRVMSRPAQCELQLGLEDRGPRARPDDPRPDITQCPISQLQLVGSGSLSLGGLREIGQQARLWPTSASTRPSRKPSRSADFIYAASSCLATDPSIERSVADPPGLQTQRVGDRRHDGHAPRDTAGRTLPVRSSGPR
jgi:hypothetical protein